ncbi:MAG: NrdH-redoxin [Candidatus Zambryskibacteria bacterium]|nr:NrdH-redoxin [Candidatus Zambryskibacteria bacterium]
MNPILPKLRGTRKVEIYSTATCHFCHLAKEFFNTNGVEYSDYNVGTDHEKRSEMVNITGQMGVPVIIIDNKDVVVGFDKKALSKLLEILVEA